MTGAHSAQGAHSVMQMAGPADYDVEPSYRRHGEYASLMLAHIVLMVVSWVFVLPVAVMLSIARSRSTAPAQIGFLLTNGLGIVASIIYNEKTPDLYVNNAHHHAGWHVTWIAMVWVIMSLVRCYASHTVDQKDPRSSIQPVTQEAMTEYQHMHDSRKIEDFRWSHDSGQGTERNTESLCSSSRSSSLNPDPHEFPIRRAYSNDDADEMDEENSATEKQSFLQDTPVDRFLTRAVPRVAKSLTLLNAMYIVVERFMILLGFLGLVTGIVTYAGIFRGSNVFNGLAHFVKGGIFFVYGILTFGRWMGSFADFGWAWNIKPGAEIVGPRKALVPSAEFTESFVIFLYGASNVFLEHLAAWGEAWTPMDLEHVSISIMFFGGGLLGMLIESSRIRNALNSALRDLSETDATNANSNAEKWQTPKSYVHSLNPLPALIIMLLGIMMSNHTQHSSVSSAIHKQWGTMFVFFAVARAVTYVTFWLNPPKSYLPSRPPSEIIASFCLISGGLIFMASNRDTVTALEHYQLDAMFTFTVTMGFVCILMAWVVAVVATKGWATRRERRQPSLVKPSSSA